LGRRFIMTNYWCLSLETMSNAIQSDYLLHWYPSTTFCTLQIQLEIRVQHGQHGSTLWKGCAECCCRWFDHGNIHMLTCKTRLPSGLVLRILNTSLRWINEFLDVQKRHEFGHCIVSSVFRKSLRNCTHRTARTRWIKRRNGVSKSIMQQKEAFTLMRLG